MFDPRRHGDRKYDAAVAGADAMFEAALEAGAPTTSCPVKTVTRFTPHRTASARWFENAGSEIRRSRAGPRWSGGRKTLLAVNDEQGEKLLKLIESLNEHDAMSRTSTCQFRGFR